MYKSVLTKVFSIPDPKHKGKQRVRTGCLILVYIKQYVLIFYSRAGNISQSTRRVHVYSMYAYSHIYTVQYTCS